MVTFRVIRSTFSKLVYRFRPHPIVLHVYIQSDITIGNLRDTITNTHVLIDKYQCEAHLLNTCHRSIHQVSNNLVSLYILKETRQAIATPPDITLKQIRNLSQTPVLWKFNC